VAAPVVGGRRIELALQDHRTRVERVDIIAVAHGVAVFLALPSMYSTASLHEALEARDRFTIADDIGTLGLAAETIGLGMTGLHSM
jgi:hypothetical protein